MGTTHPELTELVGEEKEGKLSLSPLCPSTSLPLSLSLPLPVSLSICSSLPVPSPLSAWQFIPAFLRSSPISVEPLFLDPVNSLELCYPLTQSSPPTYFLLVPRTWATLSPDSTWLGLRHSLPSCAYTTSASRSVPGAHTRGCLPLLWLCNQDHWWPKQGPLAAAAPGAWALLPSPTCSKHRHPR